MFKLYVTRTDDFEMSLVTSSWPQLIKVTEAHVLHCSLRRPRLWCILPTCPGFLGVVNVNLRLQRACGLCPPASPYPPLTVAMSPDPPLAMVENPSLVVSTQIVVSNFNLEF